MQLPTVERRRPDGLVNRTWPAEGVSRIPYWIYSDGAIYQREQARIFAGASWGYVALAAEIPNPGDFTRSALGELPVLVTRDDRGSIHAVVNRCAHRGTLVCHAQRGNARSLMCPYHQWTYALDGHLIGVPFKRGVGGQGGMPPDFSLESRGLESLAVTERHGVIFASADHAMPSFEEYLGETNLRWFDRVFDGRRLRILGYHRQRIEANWKLMFENIKDPYHATLLHVFLVSFGLFRADNPSATQMDALGRHSVLVSSRGEQKASGSTAEMRSFRGNLRLEDSRLLDVVREFPGAPTVVMQTIWPNLIVQQQSNTLAMRQIVPQGPGAFELHWTFFGYEDDSDEMTVRRLRQANLMGPAGLVSIDDSEVVRLAQRGIEGAGERSAEIVLGGHGVEDTDHMATEAAIRAFYAHYRRVMEL